MMHARAIRSRRRRPRTPTNKHTDSLTTSENSDRDISCKYGVSDAQMQPAASIPAHISQPIQVQARHIFLQEAIVLTPSSSEVSRGHFASLAGLLSASSGPSALRAAVNAVALTLLATRFGYADARPLAVAQYTSSIRQVRSQIMASTSDADSLVTSIALLSLYEILNADTIDNLNYVMHLDGITALARARVNHKKQPASGVELVVLATDARQEAFLKAHGVAPATSSGNGNEIDSGSPPFRPLKPRMLQFDELAWLFPRITSLFTKAKAAFSPQRIRFETQLRPLREEASALRSKLLAWSAAQAQAIRPVTVKRFTQPYTLSFPECRDLTCLSLRTDSYSDYVVAYMWTSYSQCQLHLANLLCRLIASLAESSNESSTRRETQKLQREIDGHIDNICASVPFMLAGEDIQHCKPEGATWPFRKPPTLLGGLSMQWVLFTIATLENASATRKQHARDTLSWCGETLGIGQAKVLAHMHENPGITARGDALRWTAFLI